MLRDQASHRAIINLDLRQVPKFFIFAMTKSDKDIKKLTIVLPTYNARKSITRAVDSVLNLLNDSELSTELIVIDDYSDDDTFEIINKNYSAFSNIYIYKNAKNEGPGKTRNSALEKISSGYVGFIDSDDQLNPTTYKKAFLDGLIKNADLITFDAATIMPTKSILRYDYDRAGGDKFNLVRNCIKGDLDGSVIFSIYKKSMLDNFRIKFSSNYYEDIVFNYSAIMSSDSIHVAKEICYKKYCTPKSILNSISEKHIDGMIDASILVRDFAIRNGYSTYKEFKSDFDYCLSGYIASLVIDILKHEKSIDRSISLLKYLHQKLERCFRMGNIATRVDTKKDKLSNFFINNFDTSRPNITIGRLKELIEL